MARIAAWNIKDGLSDVATGEKNGKSRAQKVVETLLGEDHEAIILSEAYRAKYRSKAKPWLKELSASGGYAAMGVNEEMYDDRPDAHGVAMLVKKELLVKRPEYLPLAGRYALRAMVLDPLSNQPYHLFGYHGNDKTEKLREADAAKLGDYLPFDSEGQAESTVLAGDLNTMDGSRPPAQLLRFLRPFTRLLPAEAPDPDNPPKDGFGQLKRIGSLAQRSAEMGLGRAMQAYYSYGLRDADHYMKTTISEHGLAFKLDHILISKDFSQRDHFVHAPNEAEEAGIYSPASDHQAISAILALKTVNNVASEAISPSEYRQA